MKKSVPIFLTLNTNEVNRTTPEPTTPAKPVPDPKDPTIELGKPLQNPRIVLSPKALTTPKITEANKDT